MLRGVPLVMVSPPTTVTICLDASRVSKSGGRMLSRFHIKVLELKVVLLALGSDLSPKPSLTFRQLDCGLLSSETGASPIFDLTCQIYNLTERPRVNLSQTNSLQEECVGRCSRSSHRVDVAQGDLSASPTSRTLSGMLRHFAQKCAYIYI